MNDNEAVAIAIVFIAIACVAAVYLLVRYFSRRLRSQEIIKAIEAGQELPAEPVRRRDFVSELRTGVLFVAFAAGIAAFFALVDRDSMVAGVIPLFIGIGFLVNAALLRHFRDEA